jgi:hypothetical protein
MEVVNGYACKTCTDVEYAKKGIDPAKPKDGPNGAYAADRAKDSERSGDAAKDTAAERGPAVTFSGALANVTAPAEAAKSQPYKPGSGFTFTA